MADADDPLVTASIIAGSPSRVAPAPGSSGISDPDWDGDAVEALRAREYARLDAQDQTYLDYTGGGLYAESQLREHQELLRTGSSGTRTRTARPRAPRRSSPMRRGARCWRS